MAFSTFPLPDPAPDPVAASARVAAQADMVDQVMQSFGTVVGKRLADQQAMMQGVGNKLVRAADKRVKGQQQLVNDVTTSAIVNASQRVTAQQATVGELTGKLMSAAAPSLTGPVGAVSGETVGVGSTVGGTGGVVWYCTKWWPPGQPSSPQAGGAVWNSAQFDAYIAAGGDPVSWSTYLGMPEGWDGPGAVLFSSQAAAQNFCGPSPGTGGGSGGGPICPPGTAPGLRAEAMPGEPAKCVPVKFWCLQCGPVGAPTYFVVPDSGLAAAMADDATCAVFGGPYDTKEAAFAACGPPPGGGGGGVGDGGGGGPVCCPPVFETAKVSDDCGKLPPCPPLALKWEDFGLTGSPEWCLHFTEIKDGITAAANAITTWVFHVVDVADLDNGPAAPAWADMKASYNPFIVAVRGLIRILWCFGRDLIARLKCLIEYMRQIAAALPGCKGLDLVALSVLKAVINWGKNTVAGFNFGVRLTISLEIRLDSIEKLIEYMIASLCPTEIPGLSEAIAAYSHGLIGFPQYQCWLGVHGYSEKVYDPILMGAQHEQTWQDVMLYGRLFRLPGDQINDALKQHAGLRDQERLQWEYLYDPIPNFQQWLTWERADVTKPQTVATFELDTGFAAFWTGQGGHESWSRGLREEDAQRDWRAQFRVPGEQQAQQWLREYWPGRPLVTHPFTAEMWTAALGMENWAPPVERFLEFNAFRFLTITEARQGWRRGLVADGDMVDYVRAQGAKPELLPLQVLMEAQDARRAYMRDARGFTYSTLVGALQWGILDIPTVAAEMALQGYRPDMLPVTAAAAVVSYATRQAARGAMMASRKVTQLAISGYAAGTTNKNAAQSALKSAGWTTDSINAVLAAEDGMIAQKLALQSLAVVKRAYMGGEIAASQLVPLLTGVGITAPRAAQYAQAWEFERSTTHKMATSGQILKWVQEGLLDAGVARQRLANLGYRDPDLTLMMLENAQKIAKALAAAEAKAEKAAEAQAAKLARAARLAAAAQAAILKQAEHQEPLAALKKEYCDGIITESYVVQRLTDFGYQSDVIANYITDWRANPKCTPSG